MWRCPNCQEIIQSFAMEWKALYHSPATVTKDRVVIRSDPEYMGDEEDELLCSECGFDVDALELTWVDQ